VIAGISRSYGFDVRLARVVFAIACWPVPVLIPVYIAAWILLPSPERAASVRQLLFERHRVPWRTRFIVVVAFFAVLASGTLFTIFSPFHTHGLSWAFALIVLGVLLWIMPDRGHDGGSTPPPPPRPRASTRWSSPAGPAARVAQDIPLAPAMPRRPRYPIGAVATAATVCGIAFAAAGDAFGWWHVSVLDAAVTVSLVLLCAAVVSAVVNRRLSPLVAAIPLAMIATFLLVVRPNLSGGSGKRTVLVTTVAEAERPQRQATGQLTVDLTAPLTSDRPVTIDAKLGVGRLHILLPADAVLTMDATVGAGHIVIEGHETAAGLHVSDRDTNQPRGASGTAFVIHAAVGAGELAIDRDSAATGR